MRFDRLDLNLLVALDAMIERRNVSLAARDLCLSQSAMSGALNRLRDFFGDELLVQSGRAMLLTTKAEELAGPVREALLHIRTHITTPVRFDPATSDRTFSIVASDYAYAVLFAGVLRELSQVAPFVRFDFTTPGQAAIEGLIRGEIDLLMTIDTHLEKNYPSQRIFDDELVIVCWDQNDRCKDQLDAETFCELGHATVQFDSDRSPAHAEIVYGNLGIDRQVEVRVPSFSALPQAVVGTNRLATMHSRHAAMFARFMPLRIMPPPFKMPKITETAQWHGMRDGDQGLKWLVNYLVDAAERLDTAD